MSSRAETGWLSAAIKEMRRSPFHATRSAADPGSGEFTGYWLPLPATSPAWPVWTPSSDSTLSSKRVFLAALGTSALTFYPGLYLAGIGGSTSEAKGIPILMAGFAVPLIGTAAGAKLAGARFPTALAGSLLGLVIATPVFFATAGLAGDRGLWVALALPPAIQAGITTLMASHFN